MNGKIATGIILLIFCISVANADSIIHIDPENSRITIDGVSITGIPEEVIGYDYIITKSGSTYYAENASNGEVEYSDSTAASVIDNAIANGGTKFYIGENVVWIPTADSIPGGLTIVGADWETTQIKSSNPAAIGVSIGSGTSIENFEIYDGSGDQAGTARSIKFYQNIRNEATGCAAYDSMISEYWVGQYSYDIPGIGVNGKGMGDMYWASIDGNGTGLRAWAINASMYGNCIRARNYGKGEAVYVASESGSTGDLIKTVAGDDNTHIYCYSDTDGTTTNSVVRLSSLSMTSGHIIDIFQGVGDATGDAIHMNMGYDGGGTGTFTGNFLNCEKDGVSQFTIDDDGDIYLPAGGITFYVNGNPVAVLNESGFSNL